MGDEDASIAVGMLIVLPSPDPSTVRFSCVSALRDVIVTKLFSLSFIPFTLAITVDAVSDEVKFGINSDVKLGGKFKAILTLTSLLIVFWKASVIVRDAVI